MGSYGGPGERERERERERDLLGNNVHECGRRPGRRRRSLFVFSGYYRGTQGLWDLEAERERFIRKQCP